ncbi:MAG: homoserine kinase [Alphaproteobacteria bacterium]|nr:homoserine kinase [Alphaproteobacteria bacterium]
MAVYTRLTDKQLADFVSLYDIGKVEKLVDIEGGIENTNYFLYTDRNVYLLTIYEKRVNPEQLPFFMNLMTHLRSNGLNCPLPVVAKNGKTLNEVNGKIASITTFLSGQAVKHIRMEHCYELGKAMAQMHKMGMSFPQSRKNDLSTDGWAKLIAKIGKSANFVSEGLADEIAYEYEDIVSKWPKDLPKGIIHADLFPDNVFFQEKNLSGIIDFYFACTDYFVYELAICINCWCFEQDTWEFNATKANYLLTGYNKVRPLSGKEKEALPILCRGAALRFLLTRTYDYLNRDPNALVKVKDPNEYIRKLRFHHYVKSYFEYGYFS